MNKKTKKNVILLLMIICFIGTVYYSYKVFTWKKAVNENIEILNEINGYVIIEPDEKVDEKKYNIDFKSLKKKNSDTVAFLKVNNTKINHIVVKGKDNDYYLHHNFNKQYNIAGWVFADYHNKFDLKDKNIVIYGHNMRNGTMFGTLRTVVTSDWYKNKKNHLIDFVTESGEYTYQVFSVYTIKSEMYYINTKFKDNKEFNKFVNTIKSRSIHNFNVKVDGSDQILTLSSCYSAGRRVVLHAKLVKNK